MKVEPAVLEIDKPPVIHVDRDMATPHPIGGGVRENLRHIQPLAPIG
jgi:hypothetical protein